MKYFFILITLISCAHKPQKSAEVPEMVSLGAALDHIRQSYILGCAEAMKEKGFKNFYFNCRDKGVKHGEEVKKLIGSDHQFEQPKN